jgi:hypothetical protein
MPECNESRADNIDSGVFEESFEDPLRVPSEWVSGGMP